MPWKKNCQNVFQAFKTHLFIGEKGGYPKSMNFEVSCHLRWEKENNFLCRKYLQMDSRKCTFANIKYFRY